MYERRTLSNMTPEEYSNAYDEGWKDALETIKGVTPDGRPVSAWQAELSFAEQERSKAERRNKELDVLMAALHVRKIDIENKPWNLDTVITLHGIDMVTADNMADAIIKKAKIPKD